MNNDIRLELKTFVFQVEQMRMAQARLADLQSGAARESEDAITHITEMKRQLELSVDQSIKDFNKLNEVRITPEQITADNSFKTSLEQKLSEWEKELEDVQREVMEVALNDVSSGNGRSEKYNQLERLETELKAKINEAYAKLGKVQERIASPGFNNTVNEILNNAKR